MTEMKDDMGNIVDLEALYSEEFDPEQQIREGLQYDEEQRILRRGEYKEQELKNSRLRAIRAAMLKRLKKHFKMGQMFTVSMAAERTGCDESEMSSYLMSESTKPGTRIEYEDGKYFINNPFI